MFLGAGAFHLTIMSQKTNKQKKKKKQTKKRAKIAFISSIPIRLLRDILLVRCKSVLLFRLERELCQVEWICFRVENSLLHNISPFAEIFCRIDSALGVHLLQPSPPLGVVLDNRGISFRSRGSQCLIFPKI